MAKEPRGLFRRLRSTVYRKLWALSHAAVGTRLYEWKWSSDRALVRDPLLFDAGHSHRRWLIDQLRDFAPFRSILEVGAGAGANVQLLAQAFVRATIIGMDINRTAVAHGNARIAELGLHHAKLMVGRASELDRAGTAFDLILTDAVLLYIGPDQIELVLRQMLRLARRALIVLELHDEGRNTEPCRLGMHTSDGWVRDYRALFHWLEPGARVEIRKIPPEVWSTGRWPVLGHAIVVDRSRATNLGAERRLR